MIVPSYNSVRDANAMQLNRQLTADSSNYPSITISKVFDQSASVQGQRSKEAKTLTNLDFKCDKKVKESSGPWRNNTSVMGNA